MLFDLWLTVVENNEAIQVIAYIAEVFLSRIQSELESLKIKILHYNAIAVLFCKYLRSGGNLASV